MDRHQIGALKSSELSLVGTEPIRSDTSTLGLKRQEHVHRTMYSQALRHLRILRLRPLDSESGNSFHKVTETSTLFSPDTTFSEFVTVKRVVTKVDLIEGEVCATKMILERTSFRVGKVEEAILANMNA